VSRGPGQTVDSAPRLFLLLLTHAPVMGRRWGSVALRVSIAVLTRTFFQPDEFFQSLEVAHRLVFGYGHLTWEWLALIPVRSFAFPLLFTPAYWLAKVTHLDHTPLLVRLSGSCVSGMPPKLSGHYRSFCPRLPLVSLPLSQTWLSMI